MDDGGCALSTSKGIRVTGIAMSERQLIPFIRYSSLRNIAMITRLQNLNGVANPNAALHGSRDHLHAQKPILRPTRIDVAKLPKRPIWLARMPFSRYRIDVWKLAPGRPASYEVFVASNPYPLPTIFGIRVRSGDDEVGPESESAQFWCVFEHFRRECLHTGQIEDM